jgi:hypothetical protein
MFARKLKLLLTATTFTHFHVILPGLEQGESRATSHRCVVSPAKAGSEFPGRALAARLKSEVVPCYKASRRRG